MRIRLWCFAFAFAVAACSHKPPDQKLADDIDPAASWIATLDFATSSWLANRVPTRFVEESLKSAKKELDKARETTDKSDASEQLKDAVQQQLRLAADSADELRGALQRSDHAAAQRARSHFSSAYAALHQIEEQHQQ